ncbi:ABC transporter permease [Allorhizocola rhizosphaerae]|uniref:ABC transporter permease n=1 Tax=Allorhizocola rhizosphaerae TaxID=1872709 RepID=UPI000E3C3A46|nr:ABC transporter permease [Allorhizocola rhizosphaerae]
MTLYLTWTELKLLAREPLVLVVTLLFPLLLMALLLASFAGDTDPVFMGLAGTDFYVTSYLGAAVAAMGFMGTPTHLASYRDSGVLRRFQAAGVPTASFVTSQVLVMSVLAVVGAAAMIGLAYAGFDIAAPRSVGGVVVGFVAGILAFAGIGTLLGSLMPSARAAQGLGLLLFFGTFFLVGGGPPPGVLPDALNDAASLTPTGLLVDAIRTPWTGGGVDWIAVAALAGVALITLPLTTRFSGRS